MNFLIVDKTKSSCRSSAPPLADGVTPVKADKAEQTRTAGGLAH